MKKIYYHQLKTLIVFIAFICNAKASYAQVMHTESFDTTAFPPNGWNLSVVGGPNQLWVQRALGTFPTCNPHSGAGMARFSARNAPAGTQQTFTTPVIDYSNTNGSTPTFSLWIYRDSSSTAGDSITLFVNTSNSITGATRLGAVARSRYFILPTNEAVNGWYNYSFNIPSNFNTSTNYIILNGTSQAGANIYIDDVQWDEYPTPCSGAPSAGTVISSSSLVCGGTGNVDLSLSGGSSSNSGIVYQWQASSSSAGPWTDFGSGASTTNSGTLTSTSYFRCYVTCTASSLSDTTQAIEVVVNPNPNPIVTVSPTGQLNYCAGSAPLVITAAGALSYSWSPATGLSVDTGATVEAAPTANTNYVITGTDNFGCIGTLNITVNYRTAPIFTVTANRTSVCEGDTTVLHAFGQGGPGGGNQYQWNPGAVTGANPIVTVNAATTYTVIATNQAGCTKADSISISIANGVNPNFGYTTNNYTVNFSDSSDAAITWMWLFGDGNASFSQNPTYTYSSPGTYDVTLIVSNGVCSPDTIVKTITIQAIGLSTLIDGKQLTVFPNPAQTTATINFESRSSSAKIELLNTLGESILSKTITPSYGNIYSEQIDMKNIPSGIYFAKITSSSGSGIVKVIKE
jgi:PKD repeat protein